MAQGLLKRVIALFGWFASVLTTARSFAANSIMAQLRTKHIENLIRFRKRSICLSHAIQEKIFPLALRNKSLRRTANALVIESRRFGPRACAFNKRPCLKCKSPCGHPPWESPRIWLGGQGHTSSLIAIQFSPTRHCNAFGLLAPGEVWSWGFFTTVATTVGSLFRIFNVDTLCRAWLGVASPIPDTISIERRIGLTHAEKESLTPIQCSSDHNIKPCKHHPITNFSRTISAVGLHN